MKLGAQNRNSVIMAAVLAVVALFMVWRTFFSGSGEVIASKPPVAVQTSTPKAGPQARRIGGRRQITPQPKPTVTASLDPRLRFDLLKGSEETEYKGAGRNIFRAQAEPEIPVVVKTPIVPKQEDTTAKVDTGPPLPPPPPPINIKFFGFANRAGEPRQVFLLQNDDVFIAKENDVINRRYKVVKINNTSVEIEDLLANNKQTIPLTAG
jgi:hypothetical protein